MKLYYILGYIFLSFFLSGCKGCLSRLYAVHEEIPDNDIIINAPDLSRSMLLNHLDHDLTNDTASYEVYTSFNGLDMGKSDRIVHFKRAPDEYYWVCVDKNPCRIAAAFNKRIDSNWMFKIDRIDQVEVNRMGERFLREMVLKSDPSATFTIGQDSR